MKLPPTWIARKPAGMSGRDAGETSSKAAGAKGWRLAWAEADLPAGERIRSRIVWTGALVSREGRDAVGPVNGELFIRGEDDETLDGSLAENPTAIRSSRQAAKAPARAAKPAAKAEGKSATRAAKASPAE